MSRDVEGYHSDQVNIWQAIGEIRTDVKQTREDVSFIRGKMEGKEGVEDKKHNWTQTVFNAVVLVAVTVVGYFSLNR